MAKYKLLTQHVTSESVILEPGTEVGDDTDWPWKGEPSIHMVGVDEEGKQKVNELHQKLYGRDAPAQEAEEPSEEDKKAEQEEEKLKAAEPVSKLQEMERHEEETGEEVVPRRVVSPTTNSTPTRGGRTGGGAGPATPQIDQENIRPKNPNEDMSPKG